MKHERNYIGYMFDIKKGLFSGNSRSIGSDSLASFINVVCNNK